MKVFVYSRWDGSQEPLRLDGDRTLDALSELLMEGLDLEQALSWLESGGFTAPDASFRVMGVEELLEEIRERIAGLESRHDLAGGLEALRRRVEELLDREQEAVRERHGFESARLSALLERRHGPGGVADRLERFRDWSFEDEEAGEGIRALLAALDALRSLEQRAERGAGASHGAGPTDWERALAVAAELEALEALARALRRGELAAVPPEDLARLVSPEASRSLLLLRDLRASLERAGHLRTRDGRQELTPRAIRRLGAGALAEVYGALRRGRAGRHETRDRGPSLPRPDETRAFRFGDPLRLDVGRTLRNATLRAARERPGRPPGLPIALDVTDFEVQELDHATQATTVLLLDMSWSMSWMGRFPAAKRVALALDHLVRTRFPRDHFFVVGFSTRARELRLRELPEATWDMGDPFTNLQEGLVLARRLIARHRTSSPQILVVTDGQPTAWFRERRLHVEWPMGPGGVSPQAAEETLREVRRVTREGVTINTFMLDAAPELVRFVERMTRINRGRAFYTSPRELGSFVMVDYLARRRRQRRR